MISCGLWRSHVNFCIRYILHLYVLFQGRGENDLLKLKHGDIFLSLSSELWKVFNGFFYNPWFHLSAHTLLWFRTQNHRLLGLEGTLDVKILYFTLQTRANAQIGVKITLLVCGRIDSSPGFSFLQYEHSSAHFCFSSYFDVRDQIQIWP